MRQTKVRLRLLLCPFWASLKPENFHRKKTYRRPCRQNGGSDRDSHRDHSNPEPIEQAWMKRHVRDRINLWIERYQMIASGDKRERVSKNKSRKRAHRADGLWITVVAMGISIGATILPARAAVSLL